jgi:hypothetical protein
MSDEPPAMQRFELRYPSVSLFEQPDTQSRELQQLHQGDPFEVLTEQPVSSPEGEFWQVRLADGVIGFIFAHNVVGPPRPPSPEERAAAYQPAPLRPGRSATLSFLFNPLVVEEWQLWTPLSLAQCQERLQACEPPRGVESVIDQYYPLREYPVRGQLTAQGFSLQKLHASGNWFLPTSAAGRFIPGPDGTHLIVRLSGKWLRAVSVGATVVAAGWAVARLLGVANSLTLDPAPPLALMALLVVGAVLLGRWLARDDGQFLLDFLVETLRVEERPLPTPPAPQ